MSVAKFLSLLTQRSLYFRKVAKLRHDDPYEGTLAQLNREFHQTISSDPAFAKKMLGLQEELSQETLKLFSPGHQKEMSELWANISYVNCWHVNEYESAFLWSVYAAAGEGIAIRSTIGKLKSALQDSDRDLYMGLVAYKDYNTEAISTRNFLHPIFVKRKSFESERELRVLFTKDIDPVVGDLAATVNMAREFSDGHYIPIDIDQLINVIFVSPIMPKWYHDTIVAFAKIMNLDVEIKKSSLADAAVF